MIYSCLHNPQRDIAQVVPDLAIDLADCIESGVVFDTGTLTDYNDISEPSSVWRRVRSAIDAADLHRQLSKSIQSASPVSTPEDSKPAAE